MIQTVLLALLVTVASSVSSSVASSVASSASSDIRKISDIQFSRTAQDDAQLLVSFHPATDTLQPEINQRSNVLELFLPHTQLPDEHLYILNVSEFGTPITTIETFQEGSATRLEITASEAFQRTLQHDVQQSPNELTLVFTKPENSEKSASQPFASRDLDAAGIQDHPVSLSFQDVPVRQVLQLLADENELNLVASESVQGTVSVHLQQVPWRQALLTILRIKGLDYRINGNILLIAPAEEMADRDAQELENFQQLEHLAPLAARYFQVNYAKATDIAALLQKGQDEANLMSNRGAVSVDERTNTLLIRDTQAHLSEIEKLIQVLDVPVKQVMIEARMVTVRDNISDEFGIRWGYPTANTNSPAADNSAGDSGTDAPTSMPTSMPTIQGNRLNVNLPVANPAATLGLQVARLGSGRILDLELSALERENRGEIIASPRITTANQKAAYIEQGTEIPYVENAISGATSVQFKKAVLSLQVTPQITPDNRIILDLVITQNTRGDTVTTPTGPAVSIDTQEIATQVLIENGETIVLGGIYQQQLLNDISKIPLLGDIPYVGVLFRNSSQITEKRELLIFVTPRVVMAER